MVDKSDFQDDDGRSIEEIAADLLNGAVRPKHEYMRALPIATPAPAARAAIEQLVEQRLAIEAARRGSDARASRTARDLDAAIEAAVLAAYELSPAERALVAAAA